MATFFRSVIKFLKIIYRFSRYYYWSLLAKKIGKLPEKNVRDSAILFLLPEAGISLYIKTLMVIAEQLKLQGHKVYFARCFHLLERCMFMDSESLPIQASYQQKKMLCTYCFRSFDKYIVKNKFDYVDLRHFIQESDYLEIKQIIDQHPNTFDFSFDGINFSDLLEYNLFLYLKKSDIKDLSESEVQLWRQYLTSLFVAYKGMIRLIPDLNISKIIMCDEYSLNLIMKSLASKMGFSLSNVTFPFHKDIDINRIRVLQMDWLNESWDAINRWGEFKHLYLSSMQIKEAIDDLIIRMTKNGIYTYSPNKSFQKDLYENLNLNKNLKTVVAYPSSPDEVDAILNSYKKRKLPLIKAEDAFRDQIEWLDELIDFVESSIDFQLIIRLHPRMAPNHREKWGVSGANQFIERYAKKYQRVRIIWPEEKISSFDLAEIADVVTVSWSSMGHFMARLGIPVVSGLRTSLPIPNECFHIFCKTKEEYFQTIKKLSLAKIDIESFKQSYRWYHMMFLGYCVDLEDVIQGELKISKKLSKNATLLHKSLIEHQNVLKWNLQALRNEQTKNHFEENQELRRQLFRLIHFFMTNHDNFETLEFPIYFECFPSALENSLIVINNEVEYQYEGLNFKKNSPLVARISALTQELKVLASTEQRCSAP